MIFFVCMHVVIYIKWLKVIIQLNSSWGINFLKHCQVFETLIFLPFPFLVQHIRQPTRTYNLIKSYVMLCAINSTPENLLHLVYITKNIWVKFVQIAVRILISVWCRRLCISHLYLCLKFKPCCKFRMLIFKSQTFLLPNSPCVEFLISYRKKIVSYQNI